jgi:hypothetical protein
MYGWNNLHLDISTLSIYLSYRVGRLYSMDKTPFKTENKLMSFSSSLKHDNSSLVSFQRNLGSDPGMGPCHEKKE